MKKALLVSVLAGGLLLGAQNANAHCDALDGPVATAALEALDAQNVNLVLPYAPASAEAELSTAFDQAVAARASGPAAKAVADRYFVETAVRLHRAGLPAHSLQVEVTESVFLTHGAELVERTLRKLSGEGVRIALDDFGTGYASLSHLKQFPIDIIKIDRSFVADIGAGQNHAAIVEAVISLGTKLGLAVVAEGVETAAQAARLRELGCDYGQGFLFSEAVPADAVGALRGERFRF